MIVLVLFFIFSTLCAGDLTAASFKSDALTDPRLWLVEFYSAMCGSCREFAPTWTRLEQNLKEKIMFGKVNIDEREGMQLAQSLGVLDEGIPCLRLYKAKDDSKGITVMSGTICLALLIY